MRLANPSVVIDRIFDAIVRMSVHGVRACAATLETQTSEALVDESVLEKQEESELPHTFKTIHDILKAETHADATVSVQSTFYASGISVPVYENPTIEFDTQIGAVSYGEALMVHEARGRFFHITWKALSGWVLRDDCVDRASRVYPDFRVGQEHSVDHPNTAQVRALIGDAFGASRSEYALQAGEYVTYKLWRRGISILWPHVRPRVPGLWHRILKGVPNVHMGVIPKVGSVLEYTMPNEVGHVAYVEAVFPDDAISISEVNFPDSGIYNERTLTKEEWKAIQPIFIQIN